MAVQTTFPTVRNETKRRWANFIETSLENVESGTPQVYKMCFR